jgi:starch synthase
VHVLLATPEFSPIQKAGGVGDGVAGLGKTLARFGHRVAAALPFAGAEPPRGFAAEPAFRLAGPGGEHLVERFAGTTPPGVEVILLRAPAFPADRGIYGGEHAIAEARRFALYARAVVALCEERAARGDRFDVVHAHEWPAAPVPYLLRDRPGRPRTVITLHNLVFQGLFAREALGWLGLGEEHFPAVCVDGRVDFLKAGIVAADAVTTVSPAYAREILEPPAGEMLEDVLRERERDLVGIVNGVDTDLWSPGADAALPARFGPDDTAGKARCKEALCAELGMDPARPLIASLGRLAEQKGVDLLLEALPALLDAGASVVIAGGGEPHITPLVSAAVAGLEGRATWVGRLSDEAARRLLAAADLVVMPSRYEPCGLVQMEGQRYGALPVARRTGGLSDTIADASADLSVGTGFLFEEASAAALAAAVRRGLAAIELPGWEALRRRAMRAPPSWMGPARRYEAVYRGVLRACE